MDEIERKVELLEQAMTELERLSRAMERGMQIHYSQPARSGGTPPAQDGPLAR